MKLSKIELKDFRGFPGPETFTFDLDGGKNLLLYGENGSGKSSLYRALVEFFNTTSSARPFKDHKHRYSDPAAVDGAVTLHLTAGEPPTVAWNFGNDRPTGDVRIADAILRKGFLEYRSLLRTNFVEGNLDEKLFQLVVDVLLRHVPVTLPGEPERSLGWYWDEVIKRKPRYRYKKYLRPAEIAANRFNQAFQGILPEVQLKMQEYLLRFEDPWLKAELSFSGIKLSKSNKDFEDKRLGLVVTYRNQTIKEHPDSINEARLSALGLALYFAAVQMSNPVPPKEVEKPLKLLALDDVLIGLDMSNRLPVLKTIKQKFSGWQVLLLTHDRAWYEVAKQQLDGWKHYELFAVRVGNYEQPLLKEDIDPLYRALTFLVAGEVKAAAVHIRTKFEQVLKTACVQLGVKVAFATNHRAVTLNDLWSSLLGHKIGELPPPKTFTKDGVIYTLRNRPHPGRVIDTELQRRVAHALSWVLNPLSHSEVVETYRGEIEQAIFAIDELERTLHDVIVQQEVLLQAEQSTLLRLLSDHKPAP